MTIALQEKLRKTGIDVIGDAPWGTHFCQFYKSKEDLIEILVPYFKAGLENNEFCMWVTSEPLTETAAHAALRAAVSDLDRYFESGQLEILAYDQWYTKGGAFNSERVLSGWVEKLERARAKGFEGLRLTGNTFWLERSDWADFTDYEEVVNDVIGNYRMMAICTYSLDKCGASEVIDVIRNHQFALIRRENRWETVESSERRRLGEALVASEERFRHIVETAAEGIWVLDEEGCTTFVNRRMAEMLGHTVDEMLGASLFDFTDEDGRAAVEQFLAHRRLGIADRYDTKFRRRDGTSLWAIVSATPLLDKQGRFVGQLKMITDITERKGMEQRLIEANEQLQAQAEELEMQAEELRTTNDALLDAQRALRKSEEHFRGLFERLAEGFAVHEIICGDDGRPCDYRFLEVNPAFEQITGVSRNAILGKTIREVLPALKDHWIRMYGEVALTGRPTRFESYSRLLGKHLEVVAFRPEPGQFATLLVDISERKRIEGEREALLQQKDEFLAIAAHELRTPMTSLKGFAQLLIRHAERLGSSAELVTYLSKMDQQVDRTNELVGRLLDVSRIQLGRMDLHRGEVDLVLLVSDAVAETQMATDKHTIVARTEAPALVGHWDAHRLRQVLSNLLFNAVQYSPLGGQIEVVLAKRDGEAQISVGDQGIGIPEEAKVKLFERYHRSDEATGTRPEGMGLGLFVAYGIVAAHRGRIWVDSEVGRGSTFYVSLPMT